MISVVFPAYNEEGNVAELHERLKAVLTALSEPFEIIAVDDGSQDRTREILAQLSPIRLVVFSGNFGQNAALDAGLKQARGEFVVSIDSDLQNPPEEIPKVIEQLKAGYGAVVGWRRERHDGAARKVFSRLANWLVRRLTRLPLHDFSCGLKGYRREFIQDVDLLGETFIFLPVFAAARGAKVTEVVTRHAARVSGVSKHSIGEMVSVFFDLISVIFITRILQRPLEVFGPLSLVPLLLAVAAWIAAAWWWSGLLFLSGVLWLILAALLFLTGLLAEILLRIYCGTGKAAPYAICEVIERE